MFLGSLLVQTAWILAVPPFRGSDEFDHAFRAASVADGSWLPSGDVVSTARGELMWVPQSLVDAAKPICTSYGYTGRHNCAPLESSAEDEKALVASAAARYNPVFYWIIGTAAKPFGGNDSLYVMRIVAALLCATLIAAAAWVTLSWSRTFWPLAGVVATLTPVFMYSTSVAAPNGLEMAAALGVWSTAIALREGGPRQGPLLIALAAFATPLLGLRGLGPLWLASIGLAWLVAITPRHAWELARRHPKHAASAATIMLIAGGAAAAWTFGIGSLELEEFSTQGKPVPSTLSHIPVWFLQSVAAFPIRNEQAAPIVYACAFVVLGAMLALGMLAAAKRQRAALATTVVLALCVPVVLQVVTYETAGPIWQGRYGWPLSMGAILLAAAALDNWAGRSRSRWYGPVLLLGSILWAIAHTVSVWGVVTKELRNSPLAGDAAWRTLDPSTLTLICVAGIAAWTWALWSVPSSRKIPVRAEQGDLAHQRGSTSIELGQAAEKGDHRDQKRNG